jgi:phospholipase C
MPTIDRRSLLRGAGTAALAASLPETIQQALAIAPASVTGTINDVQHIVVLMQENRSFDTYFGTLRGVRGFSDPRAVTLTTGNSVFNQPNPKATNPVSANSGSNPLQPFRPANAQFFGYQFIGDLAHGWSDSHNAWNNGNNDGWIAAKGTETMVHYVRSDMPFHYALADAFTVCDNYHLSIMSSTDPNRYYLWTGWVGQNGLTNGVQNDTLAHPFSGSTPGTFTLASGGDGTLPGGPCVNNSDENGIINWVTYPERLSAAGVSWKIYQDLGGTNLADTDWGYTSNGYIGNYGDTAVLWFQQYQAANTAAQAGTPLTTEDTYCLPALNGTNISAEGYDVTKLFTQL